MGEREFIQKAVTSTRHRRTRIVAGPTRFHMRILLENWWLGSYQHPFGFRLGDAPASPPAEWAPTQGKSPLHILSSCRYVGLLAALPLPTPLSPSLPLSLCVCVCTLPNEEFKSSLCLCIVCNVMYPAVYIGPSPPYCRLLSRNAHHLNSQRPIHSPSSSFVEKEIFHFSNFLLGFYVWLKYKKFPQNI